MLNHGYRYRCVVGPEGAGLGAARYLALRFRHADEETWRARLGRGEVLLDDRPADAAALLRAGQALVWHRPPWDEPPVPLRFDLLHADDRLLAVDKPAGLPVLPCGGQFVESTLLRLVRAQHPGARPVHRLDRGTSGVVLFALDREAAAWLQRCWDSGRVRRTYRALVAGSPPFDVLDVDAPIGPVAHPDGGQVQAASPAGRAARTRVTVLERRDGTALVEVGLATGRAHQARIHLAAAGHPVAGDRLWAPGGLPHPYAQARAADPGGLLHALGLSVPHPATRAPLDLLAPPPPPLRTAAEAAGAAADRPAETVLSFFSRSC